MQEATVSTEIGKIYYKYKFVSIKPKFLCLKPK